MKTWITSDIHYYHKNIIKYAKEQRPFLSLEDMHNYITCMWNSKVAKEDTVYILGDVSFGSVHKTVDFLNNLNGIKILIEGNHDTSHLKKDAFRECFASIHQYLEIRHEGKHVVMFHFPINNWHQIHKGSFHLHGHSHGHPTGVRGRIKDVGMDTNKCEVYLLDDVLQELADREIMPHGDAPQ